MLASHQKVGPKRVDCNVQCSESCRGFEFENELITGRMVLLQVDLDAMSGMNVAIPRLQKRYVRMVCGKGGGGTRTN